MKTAVSAVAVAALAGAAFAAPQLDTVDRSNYTIITGDAVSATPLDGNFAAPASFNGISYSNMTSDVDGFSAFPPSNGDANGVIGADDYSSIAPGPADLAAFGFVGGTTAAGGVVFFDFFDSAGVFVDGFGVGLTNAGNFIYTITIGTPFSIPADGFVQMVDGTAAGFGPAAQSQWFQTADDATVGDNLLPSGSFNGFDINYTFELDVIPAPGAAALLGFAGVAAARRRR